MKRDTVQITTPAGNIEAWVYTPPGDGKKPTVILGCGVGAVKAAGLQPFAEAFCRAGYLAIAFDYITFGGSEGNPRHVVIVWNEYRDFQNVVRWARQHHLVDDTRIVVWGTSFGGMHVTRLLVEDQKLAAGIAQCPCVDAAIAARMKPIWKSLRLTAYGLWDLVGSYLGTDPIYVQAAKMSVESDEVALMDAFDVPTGWALLHKDMHLQNIPENPYSNRIAARSVLSFPFSRPALNASKITAPYLIVLPSFDTVAPIKSAESVVREAAQGESVRVPGGHFDLYHGGIGFNENLEAQLEFLNRVVPIDKS